VADHGSEAGHAARGQTHIEDVAGNENGHKPLQTVKDSRCETPLRTDGVGEVSGSDISRPNLPEIDALEARE
jgi:hypothetical protein